MQRSTPPTISGHPAATFRPGQPGPRIPKLLLVAALSATAAACAGAGDPPADALPAQPAQAAPAPERIEHLMRAVERAQTELAQSTDRLATLSTVTESAPDVVELQRAALAVQQQLQQAQAACDAHRELLVSLRSAQEDPAHIAAIPDLPLAEHPTLCELKKNWLAVRARKTELLITLLPDHPRVQACQAQESEIDSRLRSELSTLIHRLEAEQAQLQLHRETLEREEAAAQERLQQGATLLAEYDNLTALVRRQTAAVQRAEQQLNSARNSARFSAAAPAPAPVPSADSVPHPTAPPSPARRLLMAAVLASAVFVSLGLFMLRRAPLTTTAPAGPAASPAADPSPTPSGTTRMTLTQALARCHARSLRP